jgi:uncharacterized protein (DUF983 family)
MEDLADGGGSWPGLVRATRGLAHRCERCEEGRARS